MWTSISISNSSVCSLFSIKFGYGKQFETADLKFAQIERSFRMEFLNLSSQKKAAEKFFSTKSKIKEIVKMNDEVQSGWW